MAGQFKEITSNDVGKSVFRAFERNWPVQDFIGRILPQDVGKRVYLVGDILQVENDEQRINRLAAANESRVARRAVADPMAAYGWRMMYLGAFGALLIPNLAMAEQLGELTRSDEEAGHVIMLLRQGREGDRVWPALNWLREQREKVSL